MRSGFVFLMCLTVVACGPGGTGLDAAGPGFRGIEGVQRTVEGSRFTLRFREDMVEAVRTSPEMLPRFEDIARRAAIAAEAERAGCKTAWVQGDPSIVLLGLACDGDKPPKKPKRRSTLVCDLMPVGVAGRADLTCVQD